VINPLGDFNAIYKQWDIWK